MMAHWVVKSYPLLVMTEKDANATVLILSNMCKFLTCIRRQMTQFLHKHLPWVIKFANDMHGFDSLG